MSIDGLYIYKEAGPSLLTFSVNGTLPAYVKTQFSKIGTHFLRGAPAGSAVEQIAPQQLVYIKKYNRLLLFAPFGPETPPLTVEEVVNRFVGVSEAYLRAQLTPALVSANKSTLVLILSEMLVCGVPRITEPNIIQQLLPENDLLSMIAKASVGVMKGTGSDAADASQSGRQIGAVNGGKGAIRSAEPELVPWTLPWRRSLVSHPREELYIDIVERVKVRGKQHHHTLLISGTIAINSLLSNSPTVYISLSEGAQLASHSAGVHECVDLQAFHNSQGRQLEFIPPDKRSTIMTYEIDLSKRSLPILSAQLSRVQNSHFELSISTAIDLKVSEVTDLVATVAFPPGVVSVRELSSTSGEFNTSIPTSCELRFSQSVPTGWNACLKAVAYDADHNVVQPLNAQLRYSISGIVASPLSVKSVHINQPGMSKLKNGGTYKGIRYQMIATDHLLN